MPGPKYSYNIDHSVLLPTNRSRRRGLARPLKFHTEGCIELLPASDILLYIQQFGFSFPTWNQTGFIIRLRPNSSLPYNRDPLLLPFQTDINVNARAFCPNEVVRPNIARRTRASLAPQSTRSKPITRALSYFFSSRRFHDIGKGLLGDTSNAPPHCISMENLFQTPQLHRLNYAMESDMF